MISSGGSNPEYAKWLLKQSGAPERLITYDYRARDTISNYTYLVDDLAKREINHLLLITSVDHLPRAIIVGNIIAGSRGIKITSLPVQCKPRCLQESLRKQVFDYFRALIWVGSGKDIRYLISNKITRL